MLLIGIDEAGYGPVLGPLCHGLCVIRLEGKEAGERAPDCWSMFASVVCKLPAQAGKVIVDDSKKIYSGTRKRAKLSSAVTSFLGLLKEQMPVTENSEAILGSLLGAKSKAGIESNPWGKNFERTELDAQEHHYSVADPEDILRLKINLESSRAELLLYEASALCARDFNMKLERSGNKADINWAAAGELLLKGARMARPGERVLAVIDRQGGRKFYAAQLGNVFQGSFVRVNQEEKRRSVYHVEHWEHEVTVTFQEKADAESLPVALASMAAKLTRELVMDRFNAYFLQHDKNLRQTAGYYVDAQRFLKDTVALRKRLNISDADLIRQK